MTNSVKPFADELINWLIDKSDFKKSKFKMPVYYKYEPDVSKLVVLSCYFLFSSVSGLGNTTKLWGDGIPASIRDCYIIRIYCLLLCESTLPGAHNRHPCEGSWGITVNLGMHFTLCGHTGNMLGFTCCIPTWVIYDCVTDSYRTDYARSVILCWWLFILVYIQGTRKVFCGYTWKDIPCEIPRIFTFVYVH